LRRLRTLGLAAALVSGLTTAVLLQPEPALALNCSDFVSQAAAQARLREDPTDPDRIDADGDGLACENNPGPYDYDPVPNPIRGTRTPEPEPTAMPEPEQGDLGEPEAPVEEDDSGSVEEPSADEEPEASPTPGFRSPLLGPPPPPLWALQPGAPPQFAKPASTPAPDSEETPVSGGLCCVQGSDSTIGPVVMQRALGVIQPPNTGDGGLIR
jgi:hypothetical protein